MNAAARNIKNDILTDMSYITTTLESMEIVIGCQKGVGCEFCADKIQTIIDRYERYYNTISAIQ